MTQEEVLKNARTCLGPYCKGCPVCNGRACKNTMPGPGAKGEGDTAIRNYEKWREIRVQMDTLCENCPVDTSLEMTRPTMIFWCGPARTMALRPLPVMVRIRRSCGRLPQPLEKQTAWVFRR